MIFITGIDSNGKDKEYLVLSDNLKKVTRKEDTLLIETINQKRIIKFRDKYDADYAFRKLQER